MAEIVAAHLAVVVIKGECVVKRGVLSGEGIGTVIESDLLLPGRKVYW